MAVKLFVHYNIGGVNLKRLLRITFCTIFLTLLTIANLNAQNVVKLCKTCGSPLPECPHKGNHPKQEASQARNESVSTPQKRQSSPNSKIGKTRRLTTTIAADKAQAEAAHKNSVVSTMQRVDLGLSVCWAGYNLGATSPEQWGGYYAWGETEPKEDFSYYKYAKGSSVTGYTKYTNIGTNISGTKYDAARATWGEDWRLPTEDEAKELIERCHWESITYNGIKGRKITGPNGNAIFMPCAGYYHIYVNRDDDNSYYKWEKTKDNGYYMTSTTYNATSGSCVSIDMWHVNSYGVTSQYDRVCGRSVRAVCK